MKIDYIKSEEKTSAKGFKYILVTIKSGEDWYSGFGKIGVTDKWQVGDNVEVSTYEEEYNGKTYKKFKLPNLTDKVAELERRIEKLEQVL